MNSITFLYKRLFSIERNISSRFELFAKNIFFFFIKPLETNVFAFFRIFNEIKFLSIISRKTKGWKLGRQVGKLVRTILGFFH